MTPRFLSSLRSTRPRLAHLALSACILASCSEMATGPGLDFAIADPDGVGTAPLVGVPGEPLAPIRLTVRSAGGTALGGARVIFTTANVGAAVSGSTHTDASGALSFTWTLGFAASDSQRVTIAVIGPGGAVRSLQLTAVARAARLARLRIAQDTLTVHLGRALPPSVQGFDPYDNPLAPTGVTLAVADSAIAGVDAAGEVAPRRRGFSRLIVSAQGAADTAVLHVTQVVQQIVPAVDTVWLHALGQPRELGVTMLDELGQAVEDSVPAATAADSSIAAVNGGTSLALSARRNGVTSLELSAGAVRRTVTVRVAQQPATIALGRDTVSFDALNDTVRIASVVRDSAGAPIDAAPVGFSSAAPSIASADDAGFVTARDNGAAVIVASAAPGVTDTLRVLVAQRVARIVADHDSLHFNALLAEQPLMAVALDRLGSPVRTTTVTLRPAGDGVIGVAAPAVVRARANGQSTLWAVTASGTDSLAIPVVVRQEVRHVRMAADTVVLTALGDSAAIAGEPVDSLGSVVPDLALALSSDDSLVAAAQGDAVTARANGVTLARLTIGDLSGTTTIRVRQVATTLAAVLTDTASVISLPLDAAYPVRCDARDRRGHPLPESWVRVSRARVAGEMSCDSLRVAASGVDTLRLAADTVRASVELAIAVRPRLGVPVWAPTLADSFGHGAGQWAPSADVPATGALDVYYAAYNRDSVTGRSHADLHRMRSSDGGATFTYDGVALRHDTADCDLDGQGIENVAIVERADAPGFRMFYSSGSHCVGWKIRSAVSTDRRTWTKEAGIRIGQPTVAPSYSAGEGMSVLRGADGSWRMWAGVWKSGEGWSVEEWRSPDQLAWTRVQRIYSPLANPVAPLRAIYSPSIVQIAPGVWRMFLCGDDTDQPGGHSRVFTAVTRDLDHWVWEGALLDDPATHFWYAAYASGRVFFVTQPVGRENDFAPRVGQASVEQR